MAKTTRTGLRQRFAALLALAAGRLLPRPARRGWLMPQGPARVYARVTIHPADGARRARVQRRRRGY